MMRIIWILALSLIGILAAMAQLDRQSRRGPSLAPLVPQPARYFAQPAIVAQQLESGNDQLALREARSLLKRRPVPAEHVRMLASAQIEAGSAAQALVTIQEAARRGWRDTPSQIAQTQIALSAGDMAEAANRLAAIYALAPDEPVLAEFSEPVLSSEIGRAQFATVLAGTVRWDAAFLRSGMRHISPETMTAVVQEADGRGARFDCAALRQAAQTISRNTPTLGPGLAKVTERSCG